MLATCVCMMAGGFVWLGAQGLGGTDVTEKNLSHNEQVKMINTYSPVPVSGEASDIRLRYHQFQDWYFEASFTLPPAEFEDYVGKLRPLEPSADPSPGPRRYHGTKIASWEGVVTVDSTLRRITVVHASS